MTQMRRPSPLWQEQLPAFMRVTFDYGNVADQHQATSLLHAVQLQALVAVISLSVFGTSPLPEAERLLTVGALDINLPRIVHIVMIIFALMLAFFTPRLLNRGQLYPACRLIVRSTIVIVSIVYFAYDPGNAAVLLYSVPLVMAGVLLHQREVTITALVIAGLVLVIGLTNAFELVRTVEQQGRFDPAQAVIVTVFIIIIDLGLLQTFSGSRVALLQERLALIDELQTLNQTLETRVSERTRDLQVAADVSLQVTTQLNSTALLSAVVERTAEAFRLSYVAVYRYSPDADSLRREASAGAAGQAGAAEPIQFSLDDDVSVSRAARLREAQLDNDVGAGTDYSAMTTRSALSIPMLYGGQLMGVLDLHAEQVNRFTSDDTRILRTLADQIAIALRNSQLFEETNAAKEAAEKADTVKSAFLASMSHELRTPLNAIINFSKFLLKGVPGPLNEEQQQLIGSIAESGQHLLNLINDVLDMSKIEAGSLRLFIEPNLDLRQLIDTAINTTRPLLADKPVIVQQDIPAALPLLQGDRKRLYQIMLNMLSNACKFTEEGMISIRVTPHDSHLLIAIRDTGAGIAPEDADHVFTAFKQTETGLRQGGGGTGLGMPITRSLVEAHGGRIWFESVVGTGTTFFVELPIHADTTSERNAQHA